MAGVPGQVPMARGWESKSIEAQMELAEGHQSAGARLTEIDKRREGLLLSRARVMRDLENTRNLRYRRMLEQALEHLDHELVLLR